MEQANAILQWEGEEMKQTPRESELTSIWSFFTREFDQPTQEAKQMAAETQSAGAASHQAMSWHTINWQPVNQEVGQSEGVAALADPLF